MLSTLRTLLPYLLHYRWRYAAGIAAVVLRTAFTAAIPFALKYAVDAVAARRVRLTARRPHMLKFLACPLYFLASK